MTPELEKLNKGNFILPVMAKIAKKHNIPFVLNDTYSGKCAMIKFPNHNFIIWDIPFNINPSGSIKVCMNKDICSSFLARNGFSVPKSENYTRTSKEKNEDLYMPMMDFFINAKNNGFNYPLIIKPATLSQGIGIVKVNNEKEASEALKISLNNKAKTFIIQEYVKGNDYRIVVLGGKILQAYKRVPFHIVGNGKNTIKELIQNKIDSFIKQERDKKVDINDERILNSVKEKGYLMNDILKEGEILKLQDISNLSLGGTSIDCSETISPYFQDIAINVAKTLNLDMCGIDIIAKDIENPNSRDYNILEVNSAPGLDNYLYPNKEEQEKYVEYLYEQVFFFLMNKDKLLKEKDNNKVITRR